MKLTGKKLMLLLLYTPDKKGVLNYPITGRTRLMKMIFLFEKEILIDFRKDTQINLVNFPDFFAWKYGPFSKDVFNDLEFLINRQYIKASLSTNVSLPEETAEYRYWEEKNIDELNIEEYEEEYSRFNEYVEEIFELTTELGLPKAESFWKNLSKSQQDILVKFKTVLNEAPLAKILEYVYRKYKDAGLIEKSIIKGRFGR